MEGDEVIITYESLYELLRREKSRPELQKLDQKFYENALKYLREKQAILSSQESNSSIFAEEGAEKTRMQLKNVQKILKEIYERREGKILQLAMFNSRNKSLVHNESLLLPEEVLIFCSLKDVLNNYRDNLLIKVLKNQQPDLACQKEKPLKTTGEINKDKLGLVKIRVLASIPEFVGPDMNVYGPFEENQVAELPCEVSDMLLTNNQAEVSE